jgi:mannose-6-phosphate isomerase class I
MDKIPFQKIDWTTVDKTECLGKKGASFLQTVQMGKLAIRIVEYSKNYLADHWCQKGHIVYCLDGEFEIELENEKTIKLTKGMSFVVSDDQSSHRSISIIGAKLLIIDGDFLKL